MQRLTRNERTTERIFSTGCCRRAIAWCAAWRLQSRSGSSSWSRPPTRRPPRLLDRVASTDVMRAASGGAWSGKIAWEVVVFLATQVLLHLAFAGLTWLLACATAIVSATARAKFGRIVVGWFCVLAGAALVYNALWYPRTLIGAYYHDAVATPVGPFPGRAGRVLRRFRPLRLGAGHRGVAAVPAVRPGRAAAIRRWRYRQRR